MAVSSYDKRYLSQDQQSRLAELTEQWNRANAAGDLPGMAAAHAAAEEVRRSGGGYSGGSEGTAYDRLPGVSVSAGSGSGHGSGGGSLGGAALKGRLDAVNKVYDAARELQLQQLRTAYDANVRTLRAEGEQLPALYRERKNDVAARSELEKNSFNEYAASSGLNSGTAGQAELARLNRLHSDLAALGREETAKKAALEDELRTVRLDYEDRVSEAVSKGEMQRAQALLDELRTAEKTAASLAKSQSGSDDSFYQAFLDAWNS